MPTGKSRLAFVTASYFSTVVEVLVDLLNKPGGSTVVLVCVTACLSPFASYPTVVSAFLDTSVPPGLVVLVELSYLPGGAFRALLWWEHAAVLMMAIPRAKIGSMRVIVISKIYIYDNKRPDTRMVPGPRGPPPAAAAA
jgi:hypothetical protein